MKASTRTVSMMMLMVIGSTGLLLAQRERFETPLMGPNLGVWRITNDPAVRDHANYHNTQCWSPDGRYLCYTHWGIRDDNYGSKSSAQIHVYDLQKDEDRHVDQGIHPRWANTHNWLFYSRFNPSAGPLPETGTAAMWLDLDTGKHTLLAPGIEGIGETDATDTWLYGARRFRGETPEHRMVRIRIRDGHVEDLPEVTGSQRLPNPRHPVFFTRHDHRNEPFGATRYFWDLDGGNRRIGAPTVQQCHMSWLGNGEYMLLGNGLVRGRRWDEPFPSNVHFLASVSMGDISPCGRSGRYVCGDSTVADLRSGDGWHFIDPLSIICYPQNVPDSSGIYDADPKGSPDGTKVCFVSNYDLKDAPLTLITENASAKDDVLHVESTEGFPESGALVVRREVVGYERKTATTFEGLTRQLYNTMYVNANEGRRVTSFEARCMTDEQWARLPGATSSMRNSIDDPTSPLIRQRQTDVYVVVIRKPDRPHMRLAGGEVHLIPGEEHYETFGYHLLHNGRPITDTPVRSGSTLQLADPGEYQAVAVESSGVESDLSPALRVTRAVKLRVLADGPEDFSWTRDRWLVAGGEVSPEEAARAAEAVREIVHLHDGVIHREWHQRGVMVRRHDLNADAKAIRRLTYKNGKLSVREFYNPEGERVSQEIFTPDGYITDSIRYRYLDDRAYEYDHWYYDRGMPIRRVTSSGGGQEYVKDGDDWVLAEKK